MTKEEAIKFGKLIIETAEQCDDKESEHTIEFTKLAVEFLENQKTGHWIKDGDSYSDLYDYKIRCHCSICGNEKFFIDRKTTNGTPCIKNCDNVDNYCSNCGAKME